MNIVGKDVLYRVVLLWCTFTGQLADAYTGPGCVSSCVGVADGSYQHCSDCRMYVDCVGDIYYQRQCSAWTLRWDDVAKTCLSASTTCDENATLGPDDEAATTEAAAGVMATAAAIAATAATTQMTTTTASPVQKTPLTPANCNLTAVTGAARPAWCRDTAGESQCYPLRTVLGGVAEYSGARQVMVTADNIACCMKACLLCSCDAVNFFIDDRKCTVMKTSLSQEPVDLIMVYRN